MSEDCAAVGFSGEGRCIQPAIIGPLCDEHAEFGATPVYAGTHVAAVEQERDDLMARKDTRYRATRGPE